MDQQTPNSLKKSMIFNQRIVQFSKALWKSVEKDWQASIKPFDLNINEHHILWIAYQLDGASISDLAKFGVMHVSTAFNFSKKLEKRGLLRFSKKEEDKRNTYIYLTEEGLDLFLQTIENYEPAKYGVHEGALPLKELYGKFPELSELLSIIRHVYGSQFVDAFEESLSKFEDDFVEIDAKLYSKKLAADRTT